MDAEELLKIAKNIQGKSDGRNVWDRFRPAAYVLRDKGYHWPEIAQKFVEAGADVENDDRGGRCRQPSPRAIADGASVLHEGRGGAWR